VAFASFGVRDALATAAVLAAGAAAILPGLGRAPLTAWDEADYAQVVREWVAAPGLTLRMEGTPYLEKPPLMFALMGAFVAALGESERALRLPSAIFGIVGPALAFAAARRAGASLAAGLLAALFLLGVPHWVAWSRTCMLDVGLTTLALGAVALLLGREPPSRARLLGAGALLGGAALVKSAAIVFFAPGVLALLAAARAGDRDRPILGTVLRDAALLLAAALAVALPWHVQQVASHGHRFIDTYFLWNVFGRLSSPIEAHTGSPLFYVGIYPVNTGALWPVHAAGVLAALGFGWRDFRSRASGAGAPQRRRGATLLALAGGALSALALVSLGATKIGWYVMPVYPFAALAAALAVDRALGARARSAFGAALVLLAGAIAAPGIRYGRFEFISHYNVVDQADEIALLRGQGPFARGRALRLLVAQLPDTAARYHLAERVETLDEPALVRRIAEAREPLLALLYARSAEAAVRARRDGRAAIVARTSSLAVVEVAPLPSP
jgi:4-amino-4-deoxy-L-arabinose transferase-like glycosyltransferase